MITQDSLKEAMNTMRHNAQERVPHALKCGDPQRVLDFLGVEKEPASQSPLYKSFFGIQVIQDFTLPDDVAILVDKDGRIIKVFDV